MIDDTTARIRRVQGDGWCAFSGHSAQFWDGLMNDHEIIIDTGMRHRVQCPLALVVSLRLGRVWIHEDAVSP